MSQASEQENESRRTLLKHLVAAGGAAIGAAATLPDTWVKPVVDAVIVPLHAQTSPGIINPITLAGNWSGAWNDPVQGTSGTAAMTVTVDANAGTFGISLDLNGPVLAAADPPPNHSPARSRRPAGLSPIKSCQDSAFHPSPSVQRARSRERWHRCPRPAQSRSTAR